MSLKLKGATSGSIELDVPAAIGSDLNITIPATAGEIVVANTSGDVDLGGLTVSGSAADDSVNIDSSGRLLVGTSSASANGTLFLQGTNAGATLGGTIRMAAGTTTPANGAELGIVAFSDSSHSQAAFILAKRDGGTWTSGSSMPSRLEFSTTADGASSPTERFRITSAGEILAQRIYDNTTSNAANVWVSSAGQLNRSTSSAKYKTNIETLDYQYSEALLQCRPVWYKSLCENDNPNWGYWGFIAEEVAEIDPRLVHWKVTEAVRQEDGSLDHIPCDPEPEGVAYDRFVPHLLNLIKRQKEQIEAMEARLSALEA